MPREISVYDLEFDKVPKKCYSSRGTPFTRWINTGMPRIPDGMLDSVFFLYENIEDAKNGTNSGGTGFLISVSSELIELKNEYISYFYAVTNYHVAVGGNFSVIRLNTKDGDTDILEFQPEDWITDINNCGDLAIAPISLDFNKHSVAPIPTDLIFNKSNLTKLKIGIGDDVFMIGRFVDKDSTTRNSPTARFGHISSTPIPVMQPTKQCGDSYFLDMHSRSGYSGSPVYLYRTPGTNLSDTLELMTPSKNTILLLLGVHFGQFPEQLAISGRVGETVIGMSGMTLAVPSWNILELLNKDTLVKKRNAEDIKWKKIIEDEGRPRAPVAEVSIKDMTSTHQEDFNNLLNAAVRGKQ
jgi:hypothetical protein